MLTRFGLADGLSYTEIHLKSVFKINTLLSILSLRVELKHRQKASLGTTMTERQLVFEDFSDKVGDLFAIGEEGLPAIPLTLIEAEPLPERMAKRGARSPFSLIFLGKDPRVLPQRLYRLEHQGMGALTIFLVPVGKDADGVTYQATFN